MQAGATGALDLMTSGREVLPALGLAWANCVNQRLFLARCQQQLAGGGVLRQMRVVNSPYLPQGTAHYVVEQAGIRGLTPAELQQPGAVLMPPAPVDAAAPAYNDSGVFRCEQPAASAAAMGHSSGGSNAGRQPDGSVSASQHGDGGGPSVSAAVSTAHDAAKSHVSGACAGGSGAVQPVHGDNAVAWLTDEQWRPSPGTALLTDVQVGSWLARSSHLQLVRGEQF